MIIIQMIMISWLHWYTGFTYEQGKKKMSNLYTIFRSIVQSRLLFRKRKAFY